MTKKNVLLVSLTFVAAAVHTAFFMPIPGGGQEGPVKPSSLAYTEALHSMALPPPPLKLGGEIKQTAALLCSPTCAALITGRNHHSGHFGMIAEGATGFPGYDSIVKQDTTTIGTILRDNGYATSWFSKNHTVAGWLATQAGLFGQWQPNLFRNTTPIAPSEGHPSWNSQMLTHQRPGVRTIQKGGCHVSAPHERHPWASPAGIRRGCTGDGRGRSTDAHTGRSTSHFGAVQGGDQG